MAVAVLLWATAPPAAAQNSYTWTGFGSSVPPFDGFNWSNSNNWQNNAVPASNANTAINFVSAPSGVSINNIASPFLLNSLSFNTPVTLSGAPLSFQGVGVIYQFTAAPVAIANDLIENSPSGLSIGGTGTGAITLSGVIGGTGTIVQNAPNTTILTNAGNTYTGSTNINQGTLALGASGAVIPTGGNMVAFTGGTFNLNGYSNTAATAIGALTLYGGSLRNSSGSGDYYLNSLTSGNPGSQNTGGTVDLTGSQNYTLHFANPGAGVTINWNTRWFGGMIVNDTAAPLTITFANYANLTSNAVLANGANGKGFRTIGVPGTTGYLGMSNAATTADFIVDSNSSIAISNMAWVGSGSLTLQNTAGTSPGFLLYTGASATSSKPLTVGQIGGEVCVNATVGTANLTLTGVINESSPGSGLQVSGATGNSVTLTANNTYTGPTVIANYGYLSVATIPNGGVASPLGASSSLPANLVIGNADGGGTLQYTGSTATTDRGFTVGNGGGGNVDTIEVSSPVTKLTFTGLVTGTGQLTKTGLGTLTLTNPANDYVRGTIISSGTLEVPTLAALGSGSLALQNGSTLTYTGPTAGTSKTIALTASGFVKVGMPGTNLTLSGTISEAVAGSGLLIVNGPGGANAATLTLAGTNTYSAGTYMAGNAVISIAAMPNGGVAGPLGSSSNLPSNLIFGSINSPNATLQYTGGPATTDRGMTFDPGTDAVEVTNAATNLTITGQLTGGGGLTKIGPGTLTLTNSTNNYAGNTVVNAGKLVAGGPGGNHVFPLGNNVAVAAGATFEDNTGLQLGTVSLTGSTERLSGSAVVQVLNQLTMAAGSIVDLSVPGTLARQMDFISAGAAVTVAGSSSWVGAGVGSVLNSSGAEMPLTIAAGSTLASSVDLVSNSGNAADRFRATGGGTLYLTGPGSVLPGAFVTISQARLRLDAMAPLQHTDLTLDGGTLQFTGPSDTLNNNAVTNLAFTIAAGGGTVEVSNAGTTLTISGLITGGGVLNKTGPGILKLTNPSNNYTGGTVVPAGTLIVGDPTFGTGPITVGPAGTVEFVGAVSMDGPITLNSGSLSVPAASTLTLNGATVAGGFMRGAGTFVLTGGTTLTGVTTAPSTTLSQTGPTTYSNFTNGSPLTVAAPTGTTFDLFTNQGSGAITVAASNAVSASDFQTYGVLTLSPGTSATPTQLTNVGASNLYFNTGSRTFISIPSHAGQFDAGIDLHGQNAVVAGGLFVNNGYVVDSVGAGTKTVVADFGSLVKGAGFYQNSVQTVNGGKFQSGNSPGKASFGSFIFGPGGVSNYVFAIDDATGTAGPSPDSDGHVSGWGLVNAVQRPVGSVTTPGDFAWTADPTNKLTVALETLLNPTTVGRDIGGPMADFDPTRPYSWAAVRWTGGYSGPADTAALAGATNFDTSGFANPLAGTFGWSLDAADRTLSLTYTPGAVPEPGTLTLTGLVGLGWCLSRRRNEPVRA
jgi:fibronectin-binding autotransporter adhesin